MQTDIAGGAAPAPATISEADFSALLATRAAELLGLARYLERRALNTPVLTRPLLGRLLSESAQLEELLDAYGARSNFRWHQFRHHVAACRLFAEMGYKVLHLQHSLGAYRLLPVEGDFSRATLRASLFAGSALMQLGHRLVVDAAQLRLPAPEQCFCETQFAENLPAGVLPRDRTARKVLSAEETAAHLATVFLNLAAEGAFLHHPAQRGDNPPSRYFPEPVNEERLRRLELKFHNLQSLYDTFVLDTDTELLDPDLCVLRGHITVIFHLLEIGTGMAHYYGRHLMMKGGDTTLVYRPLVAPEELLRQLFDYSLLYASRYMLAARGLCHAMLKKYAEIGSISVPVPKYRGFHVRPSTLVAKIAHHYGSEVRMELDGEHYDASAPLDLFRANEKINALKRRLLAAEIAQTQVEIPENLARDMHEAVRHIVAGLAARGKVIIYERPLPLEGMNPHDGETVTQFAADEIARLLALGKIDIESDLRVGFTGDKRVLADIALLAENGYGEDNFGNNVPLPEKLRYLRL